MDLEENRLRTFADWSRSAPVQPDDLARNGFFATGLFMEAECNWCHKIIDDWQYGEQAEERHRRAYAMCPFLMNPAASGNVPRGAANFQPTCSTPVPLNAAASTAPPVIATTSQLTPAAQAPPPLQQYEHPVDLHIESNRLATFKHWPNPNISPQSLAKAGFYYLQRSDQVQCAWCKGIIAKWEKDDIAFDEHRRFFPNCPRVQLGPLIEIASEGIRDLGIQQITPPKKPKFSSLDARLRTYTDWPFAEIQRPEALAQAGLYYQNLDDQVRCFHCNIGLRSWQKVDDPWFEHAKWYPQCQFVRLVKGPSYINHVQEVARQEWSSEQPRNMTIEEAMLTPPVQQALEIGIDGGYIRNATQRQLMSTGKPYSTIDDLLKAVFGDREDAEATGSDQEQSGSSNSHAPAHSDSERGQIVREVSRLLNGIFNSPEHDNTPGTSTMTVLSAAVDVSSEPPPPPPDIDNSGAATTITTTTTTTTEETGAAAPAVVPTRTPPPPLPSKASLSLEEENRKLKDARLCKVCLDEEVGVVFLPCGHLVTCVQCAQGVSQCPMCRTVIKGFVRTYLS